MELFRTSDKEKTLKAAKGKKYTLHIEEER